MRDKLLPIEPEVTVILPAYNEAQRISATINDVQGYFGNRHVDYEIIVSADGNDGTREIVHALASQDDRLKVIGGPERRGKGWGIRQAVKIARGLIIGFADADNKVPITEFDKLQPFLKAGHDVVIGSRALRESLIERPQPRYRQLGSKAFAIFMHSLIGLNNIRDTQCGFKFFKRDIAKDLFGRQTVDGYMFDVEILALAERLGYTMVEVPIRWRDDADSRLELFSGNIRNAIDIFSIRRSVIRGVRKQIRNVEIAGDYTAASGHSSRVHVE